MEEQEQGWHDISIFIRNPSAEHSFNWCYLFESVKKPDTCACFYANTMCPIVLMV